jgi:hypothetical protein
VGSLTQQWQRSRFHRALTLGGYVAFNLPRTVTAAGGAMLVGLAATHFYGLTSQPALPTYFVIYSVALIATCLLAGNVMWLAMNSFVPQLGWYLGDLVSLIFLGVYIASRIRSLPGLVAVTGRWDFAPGTLALACAGAFVGLHMSVLLGINVAFGQRRDWHD